MTSSFPRLRTVASGATVAVTVAAIAATDDCNKQKMLIGDFCGGIGKRPWSRLLS